jgi:3-dehydroquinate synthase
MQKVIKSENLERDITDLLQCLSYDKLFVLTDENTERLCYPRIEGVEELKSAGKIIIRAGDCHKNIETLSDVWKHLSDNGATRHSLLINLGGGMLTDLGGFAAATFKRGITCVNIPTTILGAVDAAVGGKTGINFTGLKNEIGAFAPAETVLIAAEFFRTLDHANFLSGYAEMLKHSLIHSEKDWTEIIAFDVDNIDYKQLNELVFNSVAIKKQIVAEDPYEKNIRKALNLGHTAGHAFESLSYKINRPMQHGYAVAWGLICELYLSHKQCGFPKEKLYKTIYFIRENYGTFDFSCNEYEALYELMKHDKKNESGIINFTLLNDVGQIALNQTAGKDEVFESIDFLRESIGL